MSPNNSSIQRNRNLDRSYQSRQRGTRNYNRSRSYSRPSSRGRMGGGRRR
jgi:hypothetical protein